MKQLLLLLVYIALLPTKASTQAYSNKTWVIGLFGYNIRFDASLTHDTVLIKFKNFIYKSNICDSTGALLFTCNGMCLFDKHFNTIENGDTLAPKAWSLYNNNSSRYTQSSLILPMAQHKYYVVTPALSDSQLAKSLNPGNPPLYGPCDMLYYHVVDMSANAGLGKVTRKLVPILEDTEIYKTQMQACRHANGKDWWLLKQAADSNKVYKFLFTQDSVYNKGFQHIPFAWRGYHDIAGQMAFSQDGSKWATTGIGAQGDVYLGDFDRCTGMLSNFSRLSVPALPSGYQPPISVMDTSNGGLCFSPSGNLLYIGRYTQVLQYNFATQNYYKVCGWDTSAFAGYTSLSLGADNKIYIGNFGGTTKEMSVINNPDIANVGCNFCRKCLRAQSEHGYFTSPPDMPNYSLGASGHPCWPLGSSEVEEASKSIVVYPNPSQDKIRVIGSEYLGKWKLIYNSVGQLMLMTKENEIDISQLSLGVYYLRCAEQSVKIYKL